MKHSRKRILLRASQWGWRGRCPALWTRRRRRGGRLAGADRKVTVSVRTVTVAILALPWTGRSPSGRHRTSTPAAALHVLLVFLRQHSGEVAEPRLEGCFPSSHFDYLNQVSPAQSDFRRFSSFFLFPFEPPSRIIIENGDGALEWRHLTTPLRQKRRRILMDTRFTFLVMADLTTVITSRNEIYPPARTIHQRRVFCPMTNQGLVEAASVGCPARKVVDFPDFPSNITVT